MRGFLGAFSLALVAACMPQAGTTPTGGDKVHGAAADEPMQDDILGKYVVKFVDGAPPTINIEGHEPRVTIGKKRIHFQSQCISADWTFQRTGETISTKSYFVPGSGMCARALAPGEVAIQDGFEKARTIRRIRGGLYLEGAGPRLELRRVVDPAGHRCARGGPRRRMACRRARWPGHRQALCGRAQRRSRTDLVGAVLRVAVSRLHDPGQPFRHPTGRSFRARGVRYRGSGRTGAVWSALDAADAIERTPANGILVSGNGRSVTLFSQ